MYHHVWACTQTSAWTDVHPGQLLGTPACFQKYDLLTGKAMLHILLDRIMRAQPCPQPTRLHSSIVVC